MNTTIENRSWPAWAWMIVILQVATLVLVVLPWLFMMGDHDVGRHDECNCDPAPERFSALSQRGLAGALPAATAVH